MDDVSIESLLKRLKQVQDERDLSEQELARESGITKSQIYRLYKGDTRTPHIETIRRICKFLDLDPTGFIKSRAQFKGIRKGGTITTAQLEKATQIVEQLGGTVTPKELMTLLKFLKGREASISLSQSGTTESPVRTHRESDR